MNGPLDGRRKKRDEDEAERLAGLGEDKYDKMYDSEEKKRLERHRDWREQKREEEARAAYWDDHDLSFSSGGSDTDHSLTGTLRWLAYSLLSLLVFGLVINPEAFGWEQIRLGIILVAVILFTKYVS